MQKLEKTPKLVVSIQLLKKLRDSSEFPSPDKSLLASYIEQVRYRVCTIAIKNLFAEQKAVSPTILQDFFQNARRSHSETFIALELFQHSTIHSKVQIDPDLLKWCLRQNSLDFPTRLKKKAVKVLMLKCETDLALKVCK